MAASGSDDDDDDDVWRMMSGLAGWLADFLAPWLGGWPAGRSGKFLPGSGEKGVATDRFRRTVPEGPRDSTSR